MNLILAEANEQFRGLLTKQLSQRAPGLHVTEVEDGAALYQSVLEVQPEIVVANLYLPVMDGLSVMEGLRRQDLTMHPALVVLSIVNNPSLQRQVCALHPAIFAALPCDIGRLAEQITRCCRDIARGISFGNERETPLTRLLRELGISPYSRGFCYLEACIQMMSGKDDKRKSLTKEIYPAVARRFQTNGSSVERAVRNAIVSAWDRDGFLMQNQLFFRRPTNGELIAVVVRVLQEQGDKPED